MTFRRAQFYERASRKQWLDVENDLNFLFSSRSLDIPILHVSSPVVINIILEDHCCSAALG